ncbi:MAG: helix-turn-helix transcriptional regulator [Planctomycetes bacterium]|nr:helix-turn-helix transcriptional regulator [Planctomycetota bacterium]
MFDGAWKDAFVVLCDWHGRCTWVSLETVPIRAGAFLWEDFSPESQQKTKERLSRVVTLRESQSLEVTGKDGRRFRGWLWPLNSPESAVCLLGIRVPERLELLTDRERECLESLAQGIETRQIAVLLDVSISTVHTHMKRAREKLDLPSVEALIAFSARFCYPIDRPLSPGAEQGA